MRQQVLTEQQFYAGHWDRCSGQRRNKAVFLVSLRLHTLQQCAGLPDRHPHPLHDIDDPHHLPFAPHAPSSSHSPLPDPCSAEHVLASGSVNYSYWRLHLPKCSTPTHASRPAPSGSSVRLKSSLLSQTFPNHIPLSPKTSPPSPQFSLSPLWVLFSVLLPSCNLTCYLLVSLGFAWVWGRTGTWHSVASPAAVSPASNTIQSTQKSHYGDHWMTERMIDKRRFT